MKQQFIGVYGLGVMGRNIACNMAGKGYAVAVYNRSSEKTKVLMDMADQYGDIKAGYSLEAFVEMLEKPRKILLMLTAGEVVDKAIEALLPHLDRGDILIDGGNTYFKDTLRREKFLKEKGLYFIGAGISGGERGALEGPSIMPSGDEKAYEAVAQLFMDISAKTDDGASCCRYIGKDGAGHFVKMVHNGIEYADIQLICDAYQLMRDAAGMSNAEIGQTFQQWNKGRLNSYLIEITEKIFSAVDPETGKDVIDIILDQAGQKGTGKWTSFEGLALGVPISSIAESVFARFLSSKKEERVKGSEIFPWKSTSAILDKDTFLEELEGALYAAKICCYAQGFQLMQEASKEYGWHLELGEIALIWREGCIIRAEFLNDIKKAYDEEPNLSNLMFSEAFAKAINNAQSGLRNIIVMGVEKGCSIPGFLSTLLYFDGFRTKNSSANLLQAQRDFFGAHTYERVDKKGDFHTIWE